MPAFWDISASSETRQSVLRESPSSSAPSLPFSCCSVVRSSSRTGIALAFPLWIILGTQSFRVGVELFLHQLWIDGLVPKMLTFNGANVDIFIGASAPLVAWLSTRGRMGIKLALTWNVLGLLALANVVARAVLTAPGRVNLIHAETPNLMMGTFPFLLIPGFFVPLAVALHVLAIQGIISRLRTATISCDYTPNEPISTSRETN
jgi:hypothetical protein